jgi:hypothetical protein
LEKLFDWTDPIKSSYLATIRKLAPQSVEPRREEIANSFDSEEGAAEFLMTRLNQLRFSNRTDVFNLLLTHSGDRLFHAIVNGNEWTVVNDNVNFDVSGL